MDDNPPPYYGEGHDWPPTDSSNQIKSQTWTDTGGDELETDESSSMGRGIVHKMDYSYLHIHLLELDLAVVLFIADNWVVDDHTRMVFGFMSASRFRGYT